MGETSLSAFEASVESVISRYVGPVIAKAVTQCGLQRRTDTRAELPTRGMTNELHAALMRGLAIFCQDRKALDV